MRELFHTIPHNILYECGKNLPVVTNSPRAKTPQTAAMDVQAPGFDLALETES